MPSRTLSIRLGFFISGLWLPNAGTERRGRPTASELATDVTRPHSFQ